MTCIYFFAFKIVLKITIPHHLAFILAGTLVWSCVTQTILEGTESIVGNIGLLTKVPIPLHIFPLVTCINNAVTLLLALPVLIGACALSGIALSWKMLFFFPVFFLLCLMSFSLALVFGCLFVMLRDMRHIIGLLMQIALYATPVLYDARMIPDGYRLILFMNPFAYFFDSIHEIFIFGSLPSLQALLAMTLWTSSIWIGSIVFYKTIRNGLVENL